MGQRLWIAAVCLVVLTGFASANGVVTCYSSDLRHGAYVIHGPKLASAENVHRDTGFHTTLDGNIHAQPLFWRPRGSNRSYMIVATSDGASGAIVRAVGAEGDNLLRGYNAQTGQSVFADAGPALIGLHRFQTIIATQSRLYVAADNTAYAFAFGP